MLAMRASSALALLLLSGCGSLVSPYYGPTVACHARHCPDVEEVRPAIEMFADRAPPFDAHAPLLIEWHAPDEVFVESYDENGTRHIVVGQTLDEDHVQVTSFRVLIHELMHVHLWRETGDGDYNHSGPRGPWTDGHTRIVDEIEDRVTAAGMAP
jgi:hypothetical protein